MGFWMLQIGTKAVGEAETVTYGTSRRPSRSLIAQANSAIGRGVPKALESGMDRAV